MNWIMTVEVEPIDHDLWIQANKQAIAISDMSTSHIRNCIALILRKQCWSIDGSRWRQRYLHLFRQELSQRLTPEPEEFPW